MTKDGWHTRSKQKYSHFYFKSEKICNHKTTHDTYLREDNFKTRCPICQDGLEFLNTYGERRFMECYKSGTSRSGFKMLQRLKATGKRHNAATVEETGHWQNAVCPECKARVAFWNGNKGNTSHFCTVCKKTIEIKEMVA